MPRQWKTAEPDELEDDEDLNELRLEALGSLLDTTLADFGVSEPNEVLTCYDELAPKIGADGTYVMHEGSHEEREAKRREYLDEIEKNLKLKSREDVRETISNPEDFRTLAGLVDGVLGYGIPFWRNTTQPAFWWGCRRYLGSYASTVMTPEELEEYAGLGSSWKIAGGWTPGTGPDANFGILYCRQCDEDAWQWRYTLCTAVDGEHIFETTPDFLAWYTHFGEDDEVPDPKDLNANRVLGCDF
ncbi:unnamed protein product [Colletotrichum noveboracense]|uniref:Uncharacterized protein n=1 Tax=Colletotrichum noveboracense TaxID=2664923 RepID=A0A9W4S000_9PEZI|nr:unnamed protein product [Colletotrichum noveboracense]